MTAVSSYDQSGDMWEEAPPDPAATIESLRHLGYEPKSALADLIDNSLAAGAATVAVRAHWAGRDSWCAVIDDGEGMTKKRLKEAMRIGSSDPLLPRDAGDLGRFGFGLKTASFSQAREVTVSTRRSGEDGSSVRCWDLDAVRRTGRWVLRRNAPLEAAAILSALDDGSAGTIVLWRRLTDLVASDSKTSDKAARKAFNDQLETVSRWLGMVFGRFLLREKALKLRINDAVVEPFAPFLEEHPATQVLPPERLTFRGFDVCVRPFVLPHESKLSPHLRHVAAGPMGWNEQQGFYVYRRDRLIVAGDWLGLGLSRDDAHNLARISVDIPAELDREWKLDISKGTVRPPAGLRSDLLRIARDTRRKAKAVMRHRAGEVRRDPAGRIDHVWRVLASHGTREPRINRSHPLIAKALQDAGDQRRELSAIFSLLEDTVPMVSVPSKPLERAPLEDRPPDEILALAESAYESLLAQGKSRSEAAQRIRNAEPFNLYPAIVERFGGNGD
ncbi:ATP-binding protein [Mycobacterium hubeiense]|uniref:ATP-binding protein n=1 Tax=Mycobacterium hubeiense TaxID=1867256 RepID=UPI000C7F10E8|nr:ATP-binding protein [Mycobacterium sp. QGD 101]